MYKLLKPIIDIIILNTLISLMFIVVKKNLTIVRIQQNQLNNDILFS